VRTDLTTSTEGTVQVVISNLAGVVLTQTEPMRIPVVVVDATPAESQAGSTVQVPR